MVCSAADTCGHMRDRRAPGGQLVKDARVPQHGPHAAGNTRFHHMFTLRMCACSRALGRVTRVFHTTHHWEGPFGKVQAADLYQVTESLALHVHKRPAGLRLTKETLLLLSTYIMNRQASLFLFGSSLLDSDPPRTMTCAVIMVCVAFSLPHPSSAVSSYINSPTL